jgi:hypothetical protein
LAEFGIAIEVFHGMIIRVGYGIGRTDKGAGETGNAVINLFDHAETFFHIQFENLGRADVNAKFTPPAGLFVNGNFK